MNARIPLVVEVCAGTANFTYGLVGGVNARFPISRMGNKLGYRHAIYAALGLRHGQGADAVVLIDADADICRAHRLLTTPEGCKAVAAVIRGWIGEDARALWDRLRAEPVPEDEPEAVGAWLYLRGNEAIGGGFARQTTGWNGEPGDFGAKRPPASFLEEKVPWGSSSMIALSTLRWPPVQVIEGDVLGVEPLDVAKWWSKLQVGPIAAVTDSRDGALRHTKPTGKSRSRLVGSQDLAGLGLCEQRPPMPLPDLACAVSNLVADVFLLGAPGEVVGGIIIPGAVEMADHLTSRARSMERFADQGRYRSCESGASRADDQMAVPVLINPANQGASGVDGPNLSVRRDPVLGDSNARSPLSHAAPPTCTNIQYCGEQVNRLPEGTIAFLDPPYQNTTGYVAKLTREQVLTVARRWSDAGATVCVSEAEPLPLDGWHHVEITGSRVGQKRTFGATKEWLTMNREPVAVPMVQGSLAFDGAGR